MSYESDMYIDEEELDVELLEQPSLVARYSKLLADAKLERDLCKESLDLKKAEINLDIRDNPQDYKLEKVTVDSVEACILMEEDFKTAQKDLNDANFEVNILTGIMSAIEHRKSALEQLVKLYGQNYFAGPAVPHNVAELRKKRRDDAEDRAGASMQRKKPKS